MLRFLRNLFRTSPAVAPIRPGDPVPPNLLVGLPDGGVGTVSAFVDGPNGTCARVVCQTPRRTWVQTVSLHRLEL